MANDDAENVGFGFFEGGESAERDVPAAATTADEYVGFGDFEGGVGGTTAIDDGFGDFGDFEGGGGETATAAVPMAAAYDDPGVAGGDDGFGDLGGDHPGG